MLSEESNVGTLKCYTRTQVLGPLVQVLEPFAKKLGSFAKVLGHFDKELGLFTKLFRSSVKCWKP